MYSNWYVFMNTLLQIITTNIPCAFHLETTWIHMTCSRHANKTHWYLALNNKWEILTYTYFTQKLFTWFKVNQMKANHDNPLYIECNLTYIKNMSWTSSERVKYVQFHVLHPGRNVNCFSVLKITQIFK